METSKVWMRLGVVIEMTLEEEAAIMEGNAAEAAKALTDIVHSGRFRLDGESYIPQECVSEFNKKYHTYYPDESEVVVNV